MANKNNINIQEITVKSKRRKNTNSKFFDHLMKCLFGRRHIHQLRWKKGSYNMKFEVDLFSMKNNGWDPKHASLLEELDNVVKKNRVKDEKYYQKLRTRFKSNLEKMCKLGYLEYIGEIQISKPLKRRTYGILKKSFQGKNCNGLKKKDGNCTQEIKNQVVGNFTNGETLTVINSAKTNSLERESTLNNGDLKDMSLERVIDYQAPSCTSSVTINSYQVLDYINSAVMNVCPVQEFKNSELRNNLVQEFQNLEFSKDCHMQELKNLEMINTRQVKNPDMLNGWQAQELKNSDMVNGWQAQELKNSDMVNGWQAQGFKNSDMIIECQAQEFKNSEVINEYKAEGYEDLVMMNEYQAQEFNDSELDNNEVKGNSISGRIPQDSMLLYDNDKSNYPFLSDEDKDFNSFQNDSYMDTNESGFYSAPVNGEKLNIVGRSDGNTFEFTALEDIDSELNWDISIWNDFRL